MAIHTAAGIKILSEWQVCAHNNCKILIFHDSLLMIKIHMVLSTPQHDSCQVQRTYKYLATVSTCDHVQGTKTVTTVNYLLLRHVAWDGIR